MAAILSTTGDARASDPAYHAAAVTPSDTVDLTNATTALYIGTAGTLTVIMVGGEQVSFGNVVAGYLPIRVSRVLAAGTGATNIVALWRGS